MASELMDQMGKRLMARRKQCGLTQEDLAEKTGLTTQTISTAETGKKALRPENIIRLCNALEISADYLLMGRVTGEDAAVLHKKLSSLSPAQYRYLEEIINSYLAAMAEKNK